VKTSASVRGVVPRHAPALQSTSASIFQFPISNQESGIRELNERLNEQLEIPDLKGEIWD
jgi:hypothetical protein